MMQKHIRKLCLILLLLVTSGCSEPAEERVMPRLPTVRAQIVTLALSEVPFQVEVAGTLQAAEQALIASRVSGQVFKVLVHAGSKVKTGDLLVKIRATEISARLLQAETQLNQAKRNLARETKLQQANASTRVKVETLKELVKISAAGYREAQAMLDYTQVKAPFGGTVTLKMIDVGDLTAPGVALLKLESASALEVLAQIPEALAQGLSLNSELPVRIPAVGLNLLAKISELAPTVDPVSRTTQVKLTLAEHPGLRSGQFARVSLADRASSTLLIAQSALQRNGQMEQVFIAERGVARMRLVRSGARNGDLIEILSGLQPGVQVVVAAESKLRDGQPLEIVETGLLK